MANTTNYNWETPDDTDLVKDGAAAIRTLGSSVDTTTKALNPSTTLGDIEYRSSTANTNTRLAIGTTGQVLTVAGGVPTWADGDDANAIQNSIVDAKGDIIAATADNTPARLAVGTNNHRLVAASGEATGLKYVADTQNTVIDAAGDLVYGTDADTLSRLAIGTAGQVLTVNSGATAPQWATPAAGGGMTSLASGSLSGSSLSLTSISGSYKNLELWITDWQLSANDVCQIKLNNDTTSNIYQYIQQHIMLDTIGTNGVRGSTINLSESYNPKSGDRQNHTIIRLSNYADTTAYKIGQYAARFANNNAGADPITVSCTFSYQSVSAINRIDVIIGTATFSGGTYVLYGVN